MAGLDGWRHLHLESIDSTNTEAMRRASDGDPGNLWITAGEQTAGKARRGRDWVSEQGNLYSSLLIFDVGETAMLATLPLVIALALHKAIIACAPVREDQLKIKWPNDLLLNGKKLSGILLETTADKSGRQAVIIGCGVNCAHFPDNPLYPATSLHAEGVIVQPDDLFQHYAKQMAETLKSWNRGAGFANIRREWLARATGIGEAVTARFDDAEIVGTFQDMDAEGRLVLTDAEGAEHRISAADIFFGTSSGLGA